jgi:hypothetical protein
MNMRVHPRSFKLAEEAIPLKNLDTDSDKFETADYEKARSSKWVHALGKKGGVKAIFRKVGLHGNGKDPLERPAASYIRTCVGEPVSGSIAEQVNGHHKKTIPTFNPPEDAIRLLAGPICAVERYNAEQDRKDKEAPGTGAERISDLGQLDKKTASEWLKDGIDYFNHLDDETKASFFMGEGKWYKSALPFVRSFEGCLGDFIAHSEEFHAIRARIKENKAEPGDEKLLRLLNSMRVLQTTTMTFRHIANFVNAANNRLEDVICRGINYGLQKLLLDKDGKKINTGIRKYIPYPSRTGTRRLVFGLTNLAWSAVVIALGSVTKPDCGLGLTPSFFGACAAGLALGTGFIFDKAASRTARLLTIKKLEDTDHSPEQFNAEYEKIKSLLCASFHACERAHMFKQDLMIYNRMRNGPIETEDIVDYEHRAMSDCHNAPGKGESVTMNRDLMEKEVAYRLDQITLLHYGNEHIKKNSNDNSNGKYWYGTRHHDRYSDRAFERTEAYQELVANGRVNPGQLNDDYKREIIQHLLCKPILNTGNFGQANLTLLQAIDRLGNKENHVGTVKGFTDYWTKNSTTLFNQRHHKGMIDEIRSMLEPEKASFNKFIEAKMAEIERLDCKIELDTNKHRATCLKPINRYTNEFGKEWLAKRDKALAILHDICMLTPEEDRPMSEKPEGKKVPGTKPNQNLRLHHLHDVIRLEAKVTAEKVFKGESILGYVMSDTKRETKENLNKRITIMIQKAEQTLDPAERDAIFRKLEVLHSTTLAYYQQYKRGNVENHDTDQPDYSQRIIASSSGIEVEVVNRDDMVERMRTVSKALGRALALSKEGRTPNNLIEADPRIFDKNLNAYRRAALRVGKFGEVWVAGGLQVCGTLADNLVQVIGHTIVNGILLPVGYTVIKGSNGTELQKISRNQPPEDMTVKFCGQAGTWSTQADIGEKQFPHFAHIDSGGHLFNLDPKNTVFNAVFKLGAFSAQVVFGTITTCALAGVPRHEKMVKTLDREMHRSELRRKAAYVQRRHTLKEFSKNDEFREEMLYTPPSTPRVNKSLPERPSMFNTLDRATSILSQANA